MIQGFVAAGLLATALLAPTAQAENFHWPAGVQAAVSLAYDDALDSQLDHAIPALDRAGLRGSFYLQLSNPSVARRMGEWRAAAARGHELGNHTLFHQCSSAAAGHEWVQPQRDLDHTSVAQMADQVLLGNTMLQALDGRTERTLTVPCGERLAQGQDYLPAVRAGFVAIKAGAGPAVAPSMAALDPYAVPVAAPVGLSGAELIALVKQAQAQGSMVNFTFHGVGGDYLSISSEAHEELLRYLAEHRAEIWTDTFLNIMQYVKTQR
jgi:peptidoglycan/xylan/chitin deacetylase (PgdA/CDA1 family)